MAHGFVLLDDGFVVLGVFAVELAAVRPSALFEEEFGLIEIFPLAGGAVQFDQSDFDFLMAGRVVAGRAR